jgi:beta-lactamase class A
MDMVLYDMAKDNKIDCSDNYTTPSNSAALLKLLYKNSSNNQYYNNIIYNMKHTIFHNRIDKYIPESITAHKVGDYEHYVNDIAIVYAHHPYILTIFTNNVSNANEKIAQISKIIYKYQINNRY